MNTKKFATAALTALVIATGVLTTSSSADAHWRGGGWIGPAIIGGIALGALAASTSYGYGGYYGSPYYAYGGPYHYGPRYVAYGGPYYAAYRGGGYYGCEVRRRVRYTPYGPVVRRARVCY
jgi:hypothetical protein